MARIHYQNDLVTVWEGHALDVLRALPADSVDCFVMSPPYWGLRAYGTDPQIWDGDGDCEHVWGDEKIIRDTRSEEGSTLEGRKNVRVGRDWDPTAGDSKVTRDYTASAGCFCQLCGAWKGELGLEPTPQLFVRHITQVYDEVRRVLKPSGTCWMNLGDSYATGAGKVGERPGGGEQGDKWATQEDRFGRGSGSGVGPMQQPNRMPIPGLKPKDMVGIPWRCAFALQDAGWYLRSDIIWSKPNPMPESVGDRPTKSHEYLFLLTKSERYVYDAEAIKEPVTGGSHARGHGVNPKAKNPGATSAMHKTHAPRSAQPKSRQNESFSAAVRGLVDTRNKRTVWTISTQGYPGAHFATFPEELPRTCILAGCPPGGVVCDIFGGSGTTAKVAIELGMTAITADLNPNYLKLIVKRIRKTTPSLFRAEVAAATTISQPTLGGENV